jgi:hypothetical protein
MTEINTNQRLVDKVRKLLALGTSPNENEAAAAVAKAQELMFAYNLSVEDLVERKASEIGERATDINLLATWQVRLASAVAASSLCRIFVVDQVRVIGGHYTAKRDRKTVFVGRDYDTELAEIILLWLIGELNRLSNQYAAGLAMYGDRHNGLAYITPAQRKVARRSWLEGAATTVSRRLVAEFDVRQAANAASFALVVHRSADLDDYMAKKAFGKAKATKSVRRQDWSAFIQGQEDGHSVALRPGEHASRRAVTSGSNS